MTISSQSCPRCGAPIPEEAPQGLCPKCLLGEAAAPTESGSPAATAAPGLAEVAAAFPDLEVLGVIGLGGMGVVYKARQPRLDRVVALKILLPHLGAAPDFAERFLREARLLARLNHPNIVTVHDFGKANGFFYLLMEYVDGVNLRQAMRAGRFTPEQALAIVPKICEALQYAHDENVLHRDIKPENILIDTRGRVKIADFGIAKIVGQAAGDFTLTHSGARLGTPAYMAPEQIETPGDVDHRADIYSLGVVFYEMLTGELPIGRFAPPSRKSAVDPRVDDVVLRTLEKERDERFQSAGEVKTRVETIAQGPTAMSPAPGVPPSGGSPMPALADGKKWSQKAVWGAVLVAISLPLAAMLILIGVWTAAHVSTQRSVDSSGVKGFLGIAAIGIGLLGFLPGLVGTILGRMAMKEIRDSGGTRMGAGLAVFAGLCWPSMIGLILCLLVVTLAARAFPMNWLALSAVGVVLFVLLMIPVSRSAWVWTTAADRKPAENQHVRRSRAWLWIIVPAAILLAPCVALLFPYFAARQRPPLTEVRVMAVRIEEGEAKSLVVDYATREAPGFDVTPNAISEGRRICHIMSRSPISPPAGFEVARGNDATLDDRISRSLTFQRFTCTLPSQADADEIETVRRDIERDWLNVLRHLAPGERRQLFWIRDPEGGAVTGFFEVIKEEA